MTAQPTRVDLADVGPGVAWAFEFDENGRGRLLGGGSSFDLMHGRRFLWMHLILANARTRDWLAAQEAVPPEAREVLLSQDRHPRLEWRGDAMWGTLYDLRREDDNSASGESADIALRSEAAVPSHRAASSGQFRACGARSDRGWRHVR